MKRSAILITLAAAAGLFVQGCTQEQVVDNSLETGAFVGRTAFKGAVGAGKLAVKGGKAGYQRIQAGKTGFPPGTALCTNADGTYYEASKNSAGQYVCP